MSFYSIILDWDYERLGNPTLRLIASNSDKAPLEAVQDWDPAGPYSTIVRSAFKVTRGEPHNIKNDYDGSTNGAHICHVTPNNN